MGAATVVITVGADSPIQRVFFENFDSVTPPALPAGWTTSATGAQSSWVTQAATSDSLSNSVFSSEASAPGINELVSPPLCCRWARPNSRFATTTIWRFRPAMRRMLTMVPY